MTNRQPHWPASKPDYTWPKRLLGPGHLAGRLAAAAVFHLCYLMGLILSVAIRTRPAAVVIRTDGVGDALLFEPALEALARSLSPHELHLWAPAATCELMSACPVIRRRIAVPRGWHEGNLLVFRSIPWRARLGFLMGLHVYEVAVYPAESPEPLGSWLLTSMRARIRWVNYGDTTHQSDGQRTRVHAQVTRVLSARPGTAHELVRNAYLSTQWGGALELRPPKLYLTAKAIDQAERQVIAWRRMERQVRAAGIAAVIPTDSEPINRYPVEKWQQVLRQLWHEHRVLAALLGEAREQPLMESITAGLGDVPHLRLERPLGVLATAALIGRIDTLISVETGLAHAAIIQEIPCIIIRIGGHPGRYFPWPGEGHRCIVLHEPMPCEGCHNRCHLGGARCVTEVTVDQIVAAYAQLAVGRTVVEYAAPAARWLKVAG